MLEVATGTCDSFAPSSSQVTNTQIFAGQMPFLPPYQQCKSMKFGERTFGCVNPAAWNSLPVDIRCTTETEAFKKTA